MMQSSVCVKSFEELKKQQARHTQGDADHNKQSDGSGIRFLAHKGD